MPRLTGETLKQVEAAAQYARDGRNVIYVCPTYAHRGYVMSMIKDLFSEGAIPVRSRSIWQFDTAYVCVLTLGHDAVAHSAGTRAAIIMDHACGRFANTTGPVMQRHLYDWRKASERSI